MIAKSMLEKVNRAIEEKYTKKISVEEFVNKLSELKNDALFTIKHGSSFIRNLSVTYTEGIEINIYFDPIVCADILVLEDIEEEVSNTLIYVDSIKEIKHDTWSNYFLIRALNGDEIFITYNF